MIRKLFALILVLTFPFATFATTHAPKEMNASAAHTIESDLSDYAVSWNQGNLKDVIHHYNEANSTTLIWTEKVNGFDNIVSYLNKTFPSKSEMGTLSTDHLNVQLLSPNYALVTGDWLVKKANGKDEGGPFSMLYENTSHGWKIILDHASYT